MVDQHSEDCSALDEDSGDSNRLGDDFSNQECEVDENESTQKGIVGANKNFTDKPRALQLQYGQPQPYYHPMAGNRSGFHPHLSGHMSGRHYEHRHHAPEEVASVEDPHYHAQTPRSKQLGAHQRTAAYQHPNLSNVKQVKSVAMSQPVVPLSRQSHTNSRAMTEKENETNKQSSLSLCAISEHMSEAARQEKQSAKNTAAMQAIQDMNLKSPAELPHLKGMNVVLTPMGNENAGRSISNISNLFMHPKM